MVTTRETVKTDADKLKEYAMISAVISDAIIKDLYPWTQNNIGHGYIGTVAIIADWTTEFYDSNLDTDWEETVWDDHVYNFAQKKMEQLGNGEKELDSNSGKPQPKDHYYIFGIEPARAYEEGGIDNLLEYLSNSETTDYSLQCYPKNNHDHSQLISDYSGWDGFMTLTKEEYNLALKLTSNS